MTRWRLRLITLAGLAAFLAASTPGLPALARGLARTAAPGELAGDGCAAECCHGHHADGCEPPAAPSTPTSDPCKGCPDCPGGPAGCVHCNVAKVPCPAAAPADPAGEAPPEFVAAAPPVFTFPVLSGQLFRPPRA